MKAWYFLSCMLFTLITIETTGGINLGNPEELDQLLFLGPVSSRGCKKNIQCGSFGYLCWQNETCQCGPFYVLNSYGDKCVGGLLNLLFCLFYKNVFPCFQESDKDVGMMNSALKEPFVNFRWVVGVRMTYILLKMDLLVQVITFFKYILYLWIFIFTLFIWFIILSLYYK